MSRFIHTQEKSGDRTESAMLANLFTIKHTFLFDRILQLGQFHIPVIAHGEQTAILTLVDIITISNVLLIPHRSSIGSHLERRAHRLVVLGEVMSAGALEVQVHGRGRRRCRGRRCLRGCGDDVCVTIIGSGTGHRTSHHGSCADHGCSAYHSACDGCGASSSNDNSRGVMVMVMTTEHGSERMRHTRGILRPRSSPENSSFRGKSTRWKFLLRGLTKIRKTSTKSGNSRKA